MHQQLPQASPIAPGYMYGTICRVNFWVKMTTALGVTQIVIGISCMVFYMIAFFMNLTMEHFVRYMAVGLVTGTVVCILRSMAYIYARGGGGGVQHATSFLAWYNKWPLYCHILCRIMDVFGVWFTFEAAVEFWPYICSECRVFTPIFSLNIEFLPLYLLWM